MYPETANPADMIRAGLVQRGLPPHIADGFLMNFQDESGLRTDINEAAPMVPGSRGGYGLAQWTGPRRRDLEAFAASRGVPASDMNAQLDFLMTELQGPESRAAQSIMAAPDSAAAADAVLRDFLRPAPQHVATRSADYLGGDGSTGLLGGAGSDTMGLLGTVSTMNAPESRRPSIWDKLEGVPVLGGLANPDTRARLAIGLSGMSMNPNEGLMAANMRGIEERADEKKINQTVQYLQSIGRTDLAEAVLAGGLAGGDAMGIAMAPEPTQEPTSLMQNYDFLISQGYTPEQALGAVQSGTVVNVGGTEQPQVGTIPQGYALTPDPTNPSGYTMQPIPGGPEDVSAQTAVAQGNDDIATTTIVTAAQRARDAAATRAITGPLAGIAAYNPSSDNAEVYRQVDVLKSNATVSNLQSMRDASPTGGALGSVTAPELQLLQDQAGALDPKSPNFERDLNDYELTLLKIVHGPVQGQQIFEQTRQAPAGEQITTTTLPPSTTEINDLLNQYAPVP